MSQASYLFSKIIPDMERGFTIQTNFGEHLVTAKEADAFIQVLKKLNGDQSEEPATPNQFAKLYNTPKGQILVMLTTDDDGERPAVKLMCKPDYLGTLTATIGFEESEAGWRDAAEFFNAMDEGLALHKAGILFGMTEHDGSEDSGFNWDTAQPLYDGRKVSRVQEATPGSSIERAEDAQSSDQALQRQ